MENLVVKCPNCGMDTNVDSSFNKAMCKHCGDSFDVSLAIEEKIKKNNEEKELLKHISYDKKLQYLDELIEDKKLVEARTNIDRLLEENKDDKILSRLIKIELLEYKEDNYRLYKTDYGNDPEYWDNIRNIIRLYNDIENKDTIEIEFNDEDRNKLENLNKCYKKMIVDKELCEKIGDKINEYFEYYNNLNSYNKFVNRNKVNSFFKRILDINMIKYYEINRDMTIKYRHVGDNRVVHSKLDKYGSLDEIYKIVNSKYDEFTKLFDVNYSIIYIVIGIIFVIVLMLILFM